MSLSRAGVVAGLDMTTEGALTKLAYLLALPGATPDRVSKEMSISLRGELTESSLPMFRHPDGGLPGRVQTLTALGYAIGHGDLERVKTIMKTEHHWLLNDADYSGNTPIVSKSCCIPYSKSDANYAPSFSSTWQLPLRPSHSSTTSCHRVVPFIFVTAPAEPRCSSRLMPGFQSTCAFYASRVLTCIRTSDRPQNYWLVDDPGFGNWRALTLAQILMSSNISGDGHWPGPHHEERGHMLTIGLHSHIIAQ